MRYDTLIQLYGQLDNIYTGISLGLLLLLAVGLAASWIPIRFRPFAQAFTLALALLEYVGLLVFVSLGGGAFK